MGWGEQWLRKEPWHCERGDLKAEIERLREQEGRYDDDILMLMEQRNAARSEAARYRSDMRGALRELGFHYPVDDDDRMCDCGEIYPCNSERAHLILTESLQARGLR